MVFGNDRTVYSNKIILGRKIIRPTMADIVAETITAPAAKSLGAVV